MNQLLQQTRELSGYLKEIDGASLVALDTEFVWERSYYPKLGIIQIGAAGVPSRLVDVLSVRNLTGIRNVIEDASVTKILHDALQDLIILRRATRAMPRTIFDTRIAAGFAGLDATISLSGLVEELIGVKLAKTETRTNWLKRPLSDKQVTYAVHDVEYLPAVHTKIMERVRERGVESWLQEEMALFDAPSLYADRSLDDQVRRVGIPSNFGRREIAVLRVLVKWREKEARERDRPRGHIMPDGALIDLARMKPTAAADMYQARGVSQGKVRRYGAEILAMVRDCMKLATRDLPTVERPSRDNGNRGLIRSIQQLIRDQAEARRIDYRLVAARNDIVRLIADARPDPDAHALLRGWRRELLGDALTSLLETRS